MAAKYETREILLGKKIVEAVRGAGLMVASGGSPHDPGCRLAAAFALSFRVGICDNGVARDQDVELAGYVGGLEVDLHALTRDVQVLGLRALDRVLAVACAQAE